VNNIESEDLHPADPKPQLTPVTISIAITIMVALLIAMYSWLPYGIDWDLTYRPASLALLHGQSPFGVEVAPQAPFFAAPWGLIPLLPLALLPVRLGRAVLLLISLISLAFTSYKLGARPSTTALFLLSPPIVHSLLNANIEWIPLLGFALPPQIGLFFISVKPQVGVGVGLFWLVEAWRKGGVREVIRVFGPFSIVFSLSFLLFGPWLFQTTGALTVANSFNASLWPASIPVGFALLVAAIRKREKRFAMAASPALSPYVLFHSWSGALAALLPAQPEMLAAVIGLWVLVIIRAGILPF